MTTESKRYFFNPLRSLFLWAFVGLHTIFAMVLGRIHAFAPDEVTYMNIARRTYESGFNTQGIMGWRNTQLWFLQLLYLPARLLRAVGLPDYLAIRFLAIVLSAVAVYLILCLLRAHPTKLGKYLVGALLLVPSTFLWMTLGLRECFIFSSLALICTGVYLFTQNDNRKAFAFLASGNLVLFETKAMIFLIVLGALVLTLIFNIVKSRGFRLQQGFIIASVLIPILIFPVGAKITYYTVKSQFVSLTTTGQASIAQYAESVTSAAVENLATTNLGLTAAIESQPGNLIVKIIKLIGLDKKLSSTSVTDGSTKEITPRSSRLDVVPAKVSQPMTILARSGGFLFTPFPFIDNGSLFINILAFEAPGWWLLYGALILAIWRRFASKTVDQLTVFILSFSGAFLLYSALTEINVGHRPGKQYS